MKTLESRTMILKHTLAVAALAAWGFTPAVSAGLLETLNNTSDAMAVDASRADWAGLSAYGDDSVGEAGIGPFDVDWLNAVLVNDSAQSTIYIRYRMSNGADFDSFPAFYNMYIDADQDRDTGYIGGGSQLSIGADYLIQGASLYSFAGGGAQTAFSWNFEALLTYDNSFTNLDITLELPASDIGSPETFNFSLLGDNGLNGNTADYYPDGGDQGAAGDFFEYRMALITDDDVVFSAVAVTDVTAFLVTNSMTNVTYRLHFAPADSPTNVVFTGFESAGNGGDLLLFDATGYSTAKVYQVSGEF